jgi:MFS family permease
VVDRVDRGPLLVVLGAGGAAACAVTLASPFPAASFAGAALAGLAMSACVPVIQSMVATAFPEQGGAVLGTVGVAIGAGGAFAPWVIGAIADAAGGAPGEGLGTAMWMNAVALAGLAAVGPAAARACAARAEAHRDEPAPAPAGPGPGSRMTPTRDSAGDPT